MHSRLKDRENTAVHPGRLSAQSATMFRCAGELFGRASPLTGTRLYDRSMTAAIATLEGMSVAVFQ